MKKENGFRRRGPRQWQITLAGSGRNKTPRRNHDTQTYVRTQDNALYIIFIDLQLVQSRSTTSCNFLSRFTIVSSDDWSPGGGGRNETVHAWINFESV